MAWQGTANVEFEFQLQLQLQPLTPVPVPVQIESIEWWECSCNALPNH